MRALVSLCKIKAKLTSLKKKIKNRKQGFLNFKLISGCHKCLQYNNIGLNSGSLGIYGSTMHMCVKEMYMDVYPSKPINVVDGGEKKKKTTSSVQRQMTVVPCWQRCLSTAIEVLGLWKQRISHLPLCSQVESATNTFSHSHFFTDLLVFFKCMPTYDYLNSYIIAILHKFHRDLPKSKEGLCGLG